MRTILRESPRRQNMVGKQAAVLVDYAVSLDGRQSRLDCHEFPLGNRGFLDIIAGDLDDSHGHVMVFGIEVSANQYARIRPSFEEGFDEQASLKGLTVALQSGKKQTFGPGGA